MCPSDVLSSGRRVQLFLLVSPGVNGTMEERDLMFDSLVKLTVAAAESETEDCISSCLLDKVNEVAPNLQKKKTEKKRFMLAEFISECAAEKPRLSSERAAFMTQVDFKM